MTKDKEKSEELDDRLDEALEESYPASDPVAVHTIRDEDDLDRKKKKKGSDTSEQD